MGTLDSLIGRLWVPNLSIGRMLLPSLSAFFAYGCGTESATSWWLVRLDRASIETSECGPDDGWDGEDDAPDPFVEITANWDGAEWTSETREDEFEPEWGQALWDGSPAVATDLEGFGFSIRLADEDLANDDTIGEASVRVPREDLEDSTIEVDAECASVLFGFVETDDPGDAS